jgi:flagellar basal-body rod modification protein FlgD
MQLTSISQTQTAPGQAAGAAPQTAQQEFLHLLLIQMGNQDPSSPMDPKDMVAQLATLAQVEGQQQTNAQLDALLVAQTAGNQLAAASLVGKTVTFAGNAVTTVEGQDTPVSLQASFKGAADKAVVVIKNAAGGTVRTIHAAGPWAAGPQTLAWDGRLEDGTTAPPGTYTFQVTATGADGKSVPTTTMMRAAVTSVSYASGFPMLRAGGTELSLSDVYEVAA